MNNIRIIGVAIFAINGALLAQSSVNAPTVPKSTETPVKPVETKQPATASPANALKPDSKNSAEPKPEITKPETAPPPVLQPGTTPVTPSTIEREKTANPPTVTPAKPAEPELDEETKKQIEAAKQKILKEKAEREETERKAREELAKKQEREKTFFGGLMANSKFYGGLNGGYVLSLNNVHSAGFGFGGFAQYQVYEHYGMRVGVETGQYAAKNYKLKSADYTLTLSDTGALGYLAINPALQYTLPAWLPVELSVALGVSIYSVKGGTYSFKSTVSPYFLFTALYPIFSRLHVGLALDGIIANTSQIQSDGVAYALDSSEGLTRVAAQVVVRYQVF